MVAGCLQLHAFIDWLITFLSHYLDYYLLNKHHDQECILEKNEMQINPINKIGIIKQCEKYIYSIWLGASQCSGNGICYQNHH